MGGLAPEGAGAGSPHPFGRLLQGLVHELVALLVDVDRDLELIFHRGGIAAAGTAPALAVAHEHCQQYRRTANRRDDDQLHRRHAAVVAARHGGGGGGGGGGGLSSVSLAELLRVPVSPMQISMVLLVIKV